MYVEDKVCDEGSSSSSASQPKEEEPMAPKSDVLGVMWRRKRTNNCSIAPIGQEFILTVLFRGQLARTANGGLWGLVAWVF